MSRRRLAAALTALATLGTLALGPSVTAPAAADPVVLPDPVGALRFDPAGLASCTELTPHVVSVDRTRVRLDVRILLDRVGRPEARRAVTSMRKAYRPQGIAVVPSYRKVRFSGRDAEGLLRQAKRLYRGTRPAGTDVVYTMTSKNVTSGGATGDNLAGLADCIGGVRYPARAFAVGEVFRTGSGVREGTGKTMGHEIGHLLGGHHHYFSPEGLLAAGASLASPGSLMSPTIDLGALRFSTLNGAMLRGHAQRYAR